jgi:hypothetical protein
MYCNRFLYSELGQSSRSMIATRPAVWGIFIRRRSRGMRRRSTIVFSSTKTPAAASFFSVQSRQGGTALQTTSLSKDALALLRLHLERHGQIDVDDTNRETYRELERAGIMAVGHSFSGGRDSIYRLTKEGFERKTELLACAKERA